MDPISICLASASRISTAAPHSPTSRSFAARQRSDNGLTIEFRQSNHEGVIVDSIQEARAKKAAGLIINPAVLTTTSISILDALLTMEAPVIEVHVTNIHAREEFRRNSYVSLAARAVAAGFGIEGYALAVAGLASMIDAKE